MIGRGFGLLLAGAAMAVAMPAKAQDNANRRFAGAPRIGSSEGWSIKPRGRVQYDIGDVSAPDGVPGAAAAQG